MPRIASKYRNTERTTVFATQADRNDKAIIKENIQGQCYYGGNEVYLKPAVKGIISMQLNTSRSD